MKCTSRMAKQTKHFVSLSTIHVISSPHSTLGSKARLISTLRTVVNRSTNSNAALCFVSNT